jgi:hypothetical protein
MPRHMMLFWLLLGAIVVLVLFSKQSPLAFPVHPITQGMGPWPSLGNGVAFRPFGYTESPQNVPDVT